MAGAASIFVIRDPAALAGVGLERPDEKKLIDTGESGQ
jgi:hypothetical protein